MGDIKEIFDVWATRIRCPLFGYFSLAFIGTNWKAIFYLLFADSDVPSRIAYFEQSTHLSSMLWTPLGASLIAALGYPWVQFALIYATSFPNNRRNAVNAKSESELLEVKISLEQKRNELARQKEQHVLDKAKIDESVESIDDETARTKAKEEILAIRRTENILYEALTAESLEKYLKLRFPSLPIDKRIMNLFLSDVNRSKYKTIEDVDKAMKSSKVFIEHYSAKNPSVFKSSIDYVTKSLGFFDPEFRQKHKFSRATLDAINSFDRI